MHPAFIFDWSGTLSDNFDYFYKAYVLIFNELGGASITKKEVKSNFVLPYMKFWHKYFPDLSLAQENILYEKYIHQVGEPTLYPKVIEIINWLHLNRWQIFILSSDPVSKLTSEIKRSGLATIFVEVIGNIYDKGKSVSSLVIKYNLDKNSTFCVGDTTGDIFAGKFAGVQTVGISWGFQSKKILAQAKPDFLIDDIIEIKNILQSSQKSF